MGASILIGGFSVMLLSYWLKRSWMLLADSEQIDSVLDHDLRLAEACVTTLFPQELAAL